MCIPTPMNSCPATAVEDDPFDEIVRHDELLLRAEFDELIAASWGSEPPSADAGPGRPDVGRPRRITGPWGNGDVPPTDASWVPQHLHPGKRSPPSPR